MRIFMLDLRHALRGLLKAPGFALTALLTLALGIGANTAMFSAIHGLLLKPLPFREPERLVAVTDRDALEVNRKLQASSLDFFDRRDAARCFEGMAISETTNLDLTGQGQPVRVRGAQVSAGYFELLGLRPSHGRSFDRDMETPGRGQVVILRESFWKRQFGGDPSIMGKSVTLNGRPYEVIGLLPASPHLPVDRGEGLQDCFVPIPRDPSSDRGDHRFRCLGLLRRGVSLEAARAELRAISQDLAQRYPDSDGGRSVDLAPLQSELVGGQSRPLLLLMGAVALLLLIAFTNVANLFITRALSRQREVAIRASLGAGRGQLLRTFLAEGLVVGLLGSALGLVLAYASLGVMARWLPPMPGMDLDQALRLDGTVLAFTLGLGLTTSFVFGLAPTLQALRMDLITSLRERQSGGSHPLRAALVVGQVALSMLLLVSSGLLLRSFLKVMDASPGFEAGQVHAFEIQLPAQRYDTEARIRTFHEELRRRLATLPGVASVGSMDVPLLRGLPGTVFHIGPTSLSHAKWTEKSAYNVVSPGYLETLRIPLLAGRSFNARDRVDAPKVLLVNEAFAKRYFPGESPLGKQLLIGPSGDAAPAGTLFQIVGVTGNIRTLGLDRDPEPHFMACTEQLPWSRQHYLLRSPAPTRILAKLVRETVAEVDGELVMGELEPLPALVSRSLGDRRQMMLLLGLFASLALVLAGIGIYGVVSFNTALRTREFGIRMALGAQVREVVGLVLGQGFRLVTLGAVLGLLGSLALKPLLASQLVGLGALDPLTAVGVALLLGAVALFACFTPALRAARVDPAVALRPQ